MNRKDVELLKGMLGAYGVDVLQALLSDMDKLHAWLEMMNKSVPLRTNELILEALAATERWKK